MFCGKVIDVSVTRPGEVDVQIAPNRTIGIGLTWAGADSRRSQEKSVIPTQEEQVVLPDEGYLLSKVTVGAIPNNYGLITYNGYSIRVS